MSSTASARDILANLQTVWHEFGPAVTMRCLRVLVTRRPSNFLDVALKEAVLSPRSSRGRVRLPPRAHTLA